MNVAVSAYA